jgi:hypothetical protein
MAVAAVVNDGRKGKAQGSLTIKAMSEAVAASSDPNRSSGPHLCLLSRGMEGEELWGVYHFVNFFFRFDFLYISITIDLLSI